MKILIVDDDPLAGELVGALLEDFGHECQLAENGIAALECLGPEAGIELVISDLNMPLVSGLELFQELRDQGQEVAFILLTGDDPAPLRARYPGLSGVLPKDGDLEETLPALVAALAGT